MRFGRSKSKRIKAKRTRRSAAGDRHPTRKTRPDLQQLEPRLLLHASHLTEFKEAAIQGSLVYENVVADSFATVGEVQTYSTLLEGNQTLSALFRPTTELQSASIQVRSDTQGVIASQIAGAGGMDVILSSVPIEESGLYHVDITSALSAGDFKAEFVLNAAIDAEGFSGGGTNDARQNAHDLEGSRIDLPLAGDHWAVKGWVGTGPDTGVLAHFLFQDDGFDSLGRVDLETGETLDTRAIKLDERDVSRAVALTRHPATGELWGLVQENYDATSMTLVTVDATTGTASRIGDTGGNFSQLTFDSAGTLYTIQISDDNSKVTLFELNNSTGGAVERFVLRETSDTDVSEPTDVVAINQADNRLYHVSRSIDNGLLMRSFDLGAGTSIDVPLSEPLYADARVLADVAGDALVLMTNTGLFELLTSGVHRRLSSNSFYAHGLAIASSAISDRTDSADVYRFDVDAGQAVTLTARSDDHPVVIELLAPDGRIVAAGIASSTLRTDISEYIATDDGMHFARISSDAPTGYVLHAALDTSLELVFRQDISNTKSVLGTNGSSDYYHFAALANDEIRLTTATPFDSFRLPDNDLNPTLSLYFNNNFLVSDNGSAADGKNAEINYLVEKDGIYEVRVQRSTGRGPYQLLIENSSGERARIPFVSSTSLANGFLDSVPESITITFTEGLIVHDLSRDYFLLDSQPVAQFDLIDGRTVEITPDVPLSEGNHTLEIPAGAFRSIGQSENSPSSIPFTIDLTPPTITSVSVQKDEVVEPGAVVLAFEFSEPINVVGQFPGNVFGQVHGLMEPSSFSATETSWTVVFDTLADDVYEVAIPSTGARDLASNPLDGEAISFPLPPAVSGDGEAGGAFVYSFAVDSPGAVQLPVPLEMRRPASSSVYQGHRRGAIHGPGDVDRFLVQLDAPQRVSIVANATAGLQAAITLTNMATSAATTTTAAAADEVVVMQSESITAPGQYEISITGAAESSGNYDLRVYLNAAVEEEAHGGLANDEFANAQDITENGVSLRGGGVERISVLGELERPTGKVGPNRFGYEAIAVSSEFEDIKNTGRRIDINSTAFELTPHDLAGFQFKFYGRAYERLFVSRYGLITFESQNTHSNNGNLNVHPVNASIAPFWDYVFAGDDDDVGFYWEIRGTGHERRLIVQWNAVVPSSSSSNPITYQAILFEHSGDIQFNYLDIGSDGAADEGGSATVGIKAEGSFVTNGTFVSDPLLVSLNQASHPLVGSGKSVRIGERIGPTTAPDVYKFVLDEAQVVSLALESELSDQITVELFRGSNSNASLISLAIPRNNAIQSIDNFLAQAGEYFVRIVGLDDAGYQLTLGLGAVLESTDLAGESTDIGQSGYSLGSLGFPQHADVVRVAVVDDVTNPSIVAGWLDSSFRFDFESIVVAGADIDSLGELSQFDVVVIGDYAQREELYPLGPALRSWVEFGGGVVGTGDLIRAAQGDGPTILPDIDQIMPVDLSGGYGRLYNQTITEIDATHPVTEGIPSAYIRFTYTEYAENTTLHADSRLLASLNDNPVIAVREPQDGRSVYLGPSYFESTSLVSGPAIQLLEQAVAWAAGDDEDDAYAFRADGGVELTVTTETPGDGDGEPRNDLDATIELYYIDGSTPTEPVATNVNRSPGVRNVPVIYSVPPDAGGEYLVAVSQRSGQGAYTLHVTDTSAIVGELTISPVQPIDDALLTAFPDRYRIRFSEAVQFDTINAADFTIGGAGGR